MTKDGGRRHAGGRPLCGILVLALVGWLPSEAAGQIRWRTGTVVFGPKTAAELEGAITELATRSDARHVVVQFDAPVGPARRGELEAAGLTLLSYLGNHAFFASISPGRVDAGALARGRSLVDVRPVERTWKLHPALAADRVPRWAIVGKKAAEEQRTREGKKAQGGGAMAADTIVSRSR